MLLLFLCPIYTLSGSLQALFGGVSGVPVDTSGALYVLMSFCSPLWVPYLVSHPVHHQIRLVFSNRFSFAYLVSWTYV